jgi:hypothetical protein
MCNNRYNKLSKMGIPIKISNMYLAQTNSKVFTLNLFVQNLEENTTKTTKMYIL